jgi:cytochrome c2
VANAAIIRGAGSVADFKNYTAALKESGIVWSEEAIDAFLRDPEKAIPGTSMSLPGADPMLQGTSQHHCPHSPAGQKY